MVVLVCFTHSLRCQLLDVIEETFCPNLYAVLGCGFVGEGV